MGKCDWVKSGEGHEGWQDVYAAMGVAPPYEDKKYSDRKPKSYS